MSPVRQWGILLIVIVAVGGAALLITAQATQTQQARQTQAGSGPIFMALRVATLTGDQAPHPLTKTQAREILPLLQSLRDLPPNDRGAAEDVVTKIMATLTPEQRTDVQEARPFAPFGRYGHPGSGGPAFPPGVGGFNGVGPGGGAFGRPDRSQIRARVIDRAISLVERRANQ